jgi:glutamate-ammonia-ligase adenylyltransferase
VGLSAALSAEVDRSADPPAARVALERLAAAWPDVLDRLEADDAIARGVITVVAASRSLTRVLETDPAGLDVLTQLDFRRAVPEPSDDVDELVRWKQLELLRIAARDLLAMDPVEVVVASLSGLAADVLGVAWASSGNSSASPLAIIGMGKLGGRELNYASDIDLMFVGEDERAARAVMEVARRCFRVDANLRPEGRDGPLIRTLDSYEAYWARWAEPWEFQALLKARPVAGDRALGDSFSESASRAVWDRPLSSDDLRYLRALRERSDSEVARRASGDREIKRGRGGIRDVEFAVQLLQLVHGRVDVDLRSPSTLSALNELAVAGYVDPADAAALADAYRFLRRVEHALQLEDEQQTHTVPADREARRRLARVLGYRGTQEAGPTEQLDSDLSRQRGLVRRIHERLWFRPLLDALAGAGLLTPDAVAARLAAFGFIDADRTRQAVTELTRGLTRSSRMMQQLLPLLLDWLSASPDPDLGLLGLRRMASGQQRAMELANAFRDSPEAARRLCRILGTSRLLGDIVVANPDLVARLPHPEQLRTRPGAELVRSAAVALSWREESAERQRALQRWRNRHLFGIAARDVLGHADLRTVGSDLAAVAEATLESALVTLQPQLPFAVVALGRFGGAELSYGSDLDVVFVYDGADHAAYEEADRVATSLLRFVGGDTPAARIYDIDAGLRPEGRQGPLARSLDGYEAYFERWALVWERQAMLRARTVAGDPELGRRLLATIAPHVWDRPFTADDIREVRRMKARIERERIPAGEDPEFHLKLGKGSLSDIEFTVQLLQLVHGVPGAATLAALHDLTELGHLLDDEAGVLADAYRFCERTRNRWYLVGGGPSDALPAQPEALAVLARSLELTSNDLRDTYRRVTRRARRVVERRFYGLSV